MEKKTIYLFVFFSIFWGSIFLMSIFSSIGATPLSLNKDTKTVFASVLPQGWGFFSKNPRDIQIGLYKASDTSLDVIWPNMRLENIFGLYRKGRSQGVEMGAIFQLIPKKEWVKCKDNADLHSCSSKTREFHVINPAPTPLLCGEYYFTKEEISPWSYSKYSDPIEKITEMVKVDVKCIKK